MVGEQKGGNGDGILAMRIWGRIGGMYISPEECLCGEEEGGGMKHGNFWVYVRGCDVEWWM